MYSYMGVCIMRREAAVIVAGVVTNIIVVNPDDAATLAALNAVLLPDGAQVAVGSAYDGVSFTAPVLPMLPTPVAVLTPRQIRLVLNAANLRATVEAAVAASSQDVKDMWEFSLEYRRDDAILNAMAAAIGISDAQLDAMFVQGALL
jgi:hypothetical protein